MTKASKEAKDKATKGRYQTKPNLKNNAKNMKPVSNSTKGYWGEILSLQK
jgi:hypothetical protein